MNNINKFSKHPFSFHLLLRESSAENMNRDWAPWMIAAAAGGAAVATLVMKRKARYTPPKVWTASTNGGKFSSINRATAGARTQKKLPIGSSCEIFS